MNLKKIKEACLQYPGCQKCPLNRGVCFYVVELGSTPEQWDVESIEAAEEALTEPKVKRQARKID